MRGNQETFANAKEAEPDYQRGNHARRKAQVLLARQGVTGILWLSFAIRQRYLSSVSLLSSRLEPDKSVFDSLVHPR